MMKEKPFLAVWMITYNHQDYIAQALESVMMQKTDFNVHLFIGEDFSSDNTRVICQSLKQKYPNKITLILNEKNLGPKKMPKIFMKLVGKVEQNTLPFAKATITGPTL